MGRTDGLLIGFCVCGCVVERMNIPLAVWALDSFALYRNPHCAMVSRAFFVVLGSGLEFGSTILNQ
jgi:hypothetical protein